MLALTISFSLCSGGSVSYVFFFLAALVLRCCARAFSSCGKWGLLFVAVCGLLIVVVSLFVFLNLFYYCWLHWVFIAARGLSLVAAASLVVEHGL